MEETRDDVIKEESEVESNLDNQNIVTDSFVDEKLRYRDEFEDYTSLPFERDLEFHTSLGRAKARTAASERGKRVECGARQLLQHCWG